MKYIDIELDGKQVRIPEFAYEESIQQIAKILKEQLRVAAGDTKLISKILREGNKAQKEATKKAHQQQAKEDARQKNADKEELKTQKKILQPGNLLKIFFLEPYPYQLLVKIFYF